MGAGQDYPTIPCPECGRIRTCRVPMSWFTLQPAHDKQFCTVGAPLYRFSYSGEPEYISPRCGHCLEVALRKRD